MSKIVGYCLYCEEPIYLVWNASRTFQYAKDHMHLTENKELESE